MILFKTCLLHKNPIVFVAIWFGLMDFTVGFPSLVMPRLHRSLDTNVEFKNKDLGFPQTDDDVLQLEQLRDVHQNSYNDDARRNYQNLKKDPLLVDEAAFAPNGDSPELEQQLQSASQIQVQQITPKPQSQNNEENVGESPPGSAAVISSGLKPLATQNIDVSSLRADSTTDKPKAKTAESLLRHNNGQYSSFDMAQYVFWTGDEAGVAKAVEELINKDLMSRENALKFLHEIRIGIEYLQRSYANRIFPEEIKHNTVKKSFMPESPSTTTTTTTSTTTTTTPKPVMPYLNLDTNHEDSDRFNLAKTLDSISLWHKLQAMNSDSRQDSGEYDNADNRRPTKIADCEHKEYNLEEIIYKLAKIMFTESLNHGDEAQREIKKLMDFFEREHELGIIPLDLEKKVIHVLLQALSDTLTEKPELWPAAQYPYNHLLRAYAQLGFVQPHQATP